MTGQLPRWAQWGAGLLLLWSLVAVLTATQWQLIDNAYGQTKAWHSYLAPSFIANILWAVFTPIIIKIVPYIGFGVGRPVRLLGLHALTGGLVAVSHTFIYVALLGLMLGGDENLKLSSALLYRKLAGSFQANFLIYGIIVALVMGAHALELAKTREIEKAKLETELAETAAAALRAQLQPHFLFNALNAISALVRNNPLGAERMIARLADLLRLSLDQHQSSQSPLSKELEFVDAYLAIEQLRIGDRLNVVQDIDAEALDLKVPSLILQPLVENAIRHGIAPSRSRSRSTLTISAKIEGNALKLLVMDDGVGASDIAEAIGLGHTRRRLAHQYDTRHRMDIITAPGQGFKVAIEISH